MALTSKREQILEYIRTTILPKINGTGNYNLSVNYISREFRRVDELDTYEFPAIFILDDYGTSYKPMTAKQYTTGDVDRDVQDGMQVGILAYVKKKDIGGDDKAGSISTEVNKIFADILTAFFEDDQSKTFGGLIQGFDLRRDDRLIDYKDDSSVGLIVVQFGIKYDFNPSKNYV